MAGAGLTLFAVAAESDARRNVASAKVRAAELKAVVNTMEEVLSSATLFRSELLALAGVTGATAVIVLAVESPWPLAASFPILANIQLSVQVLLTLFHIVAAMLCVFPLKGVWKWAEETSELKTTTLRNGLTPVGMSPSYFASQQVPARLRAMFTGKERWMPWLAALPPALLTFFPHGRPFSKRAVASAAAGACVVALSLFSAERCLARAERSIAGRVRTFALVDAFANEAEQTGALLPVASAATIAISGIITFGVELNPYFASALAIMQALVWMLASRKALAAKFETDAAFQVESVTEKQEFHGFTPKINTERKNKVFAWLERRLVQWPL